MTTPSECSCHDLRDIENPLSICRNCGALLHKFRRCNMFYAKTEDSPVFMCTRCKFAIERPPSPVPVTSTMNTSDSIDDTLDEEESEQISIEPETLTTKPPENLSIQTRDSMLITLMTRMWLIFISMVIGYMISFI